jgi:hypothetical protein
MNGWADDDPAWWINLQANPEARVELPDGPRAVRARAADAQERSRLWTMWCQADKNWDVSRQATHGRDHHRDPRATSRFLTVQAHRPASRRYSDGGKGA